ncbi:MAG: glycosyltransferase family 2 protein, partial [Planctomycetota bacterium]|nr:glycosyltransferase family 2 protein [Planctomycetota bacterium]
MIAPAQAEALFWICAGLLLYTWLGYPLLLFLLERCLYLPVRKRPVEPRVSILLCAYNEEANIAGKIENLLSLDYPADKLEIVVASDGSQDATAAIAQRYRDRNVRVIAFELRRGKPSVINDVVPTLTGEIVLLVDARQRLERDLLRRLLPNFGDETVGGVSGELALERPEKPGIAADLDLYWRYEKWLRFREAGIDSTLGGTGAVFAFRRALFQPLPADTILDDVALPLRIVRQGYRVVMEPRALAWDRAEDDWAREFTRKARTLAGNFQVLFSPFALGLGSRFFGLLGLEYVSHKVLRLFGPMLLALLAYTNWHLVQKPHPPLLFLITWRLQEIFYLLALLGGLRSKNLRLRLITLRASFLLMQAAVVAGFLRFIASRDNALWT